MATEFTAAGTDAVSAEEELLEREIEFAASERLSFFSDAVVAIAMTLLALELPLPEGTTAREVRQSLRAGFDEYLAFLISFFVIASHWSLHHRVFRYVHRADRLLVRLNLIWLLFIVITPFTTKLISVGKTNLITFSLYAGTQAMQFTLFSAMILVIGRRTALRRGADVHKLRRSLLHTIPLIVGFAVSIPMYLIIGRGAYWFWALTSVAVGVVHRVYLRLQARANRRIEPDSPPRPPRRI